MTLTAPVQPRFVARTMSVSAALLLITAAFTLAKTGRDAVYFQAQGLYDLPGAYLGIALLNLPVAAIMLGLMRWFGTRWARVAAAMVMAVALVLFAQVAKPGGGPLMTTIFMAIPLGFGVLFSSAWLLPVWISRRPIPESQRPLSARVSSDRSPEAPAREGDRPP